MTAPPLRIPMALIVRVVAMEWRVEPHHLVLASRRGTSKRLDEARRAVCLLAVDLTALSTPQIGERFGGRDHSTIVHLAGRARAQAETDRLFAARVDAARADMARIAASREGQRFRDADPVAAAEKIMDHPVRNALLVSTDAIVAMADRLLALEEMAAAAYRLLATLGELEAARRPHAPPPASLRSAPSPDPNAGAPAFGHQRGAQAGNTRPERGGGLGRGQSRIAHLDASDAAKPAQAAQACLHALTDTLASALAALGYDTPDDEEATDGQEQVARNEPAGAAE